jgi:hypothetical protein
VLLVLVVLLVLRVWQEFNWRASMSSTSLCSSTSSISVYDLDGFFIFLNSLVTIVAASSSTPPPATPASLSSVVLGAVLLILLMFPLIVRFLRDVLDAQLVCNIIVEKSWFSTSSLPESSFFFVSWLLGFLWLSFFFPLSCLFAFFSFLSGFLVLLPVLLMVFFLFL